MRRSSKLHARRIVAWRPLHGLALVALGVALAECLLSLSVRSMPDLALLFDGSAPRWFEDERLSHAPNLRHPDHDARGFRNAGALARADIVVTGDSNSYGSGVRREEAWPRQLEASVGASVYNMGFPGWGPIQALLVLEQAVALQPQLVIEAVYPGNDLRDVFHVVYNLGQLPGLRSSDPATVEMLRAKEREQPIRQRASDLSGLSSPPSASGPAPAVPAASLRRWLVKNLRTYRLLGLLRRELHERSSRAADGWSRQRPCQQSAYCEDYDDGDQRTLFTPEYRWLALDDGDPRVREGRRIFMASLLELRDRVEAAGARFIVVWIPTKETVFAPLVERRGGASATFDAVVDSEEDLRLETLAFLEGHGIRVVDTRSTLRRSLLDARSPYPESIDGHPNPLGHSLIAAEVAREVESVGLDGSDRLTARRIARRATPPASASRKPL